MRTDSILCALALFTSCAGAATAAPFTPAEDGEVLERLPESPLGEGDARLSALRRELSSQPRDLGLATRTAWQYIERGRAASDPRYYGYAQGILAPWWHADEPPVPVLVLRATIRQHDHDFAAALNDLALALRAEPGNAQAWLTQAVVLQVRGEYAEARQSCLEMMPLTTPLVAVTCLSSVDSLNGAAAKGYAALRRTLIRSGHVDPRARIWALTLLAEIAARSGRTEAAESHFKQALAAGRSDDYLRAAYADFLLDQRRPEDVRALLRDAGRADALLLRLALAERALASPDSAIHVQTLKERFAAARARGDAAHGREEARFALGLLGDADAALALARQNWEVQREPWDARLLLEAALAAGQPDAAAPALDFLDRTGLEDVTLAALAGKLRALRQ